MSLPAPAGRGNSGTLQPDLRAAALELARIAADHRRATAYTLQRALAAALAVGVPASALEAATGLCRVDLIAAYDDQAVTE